jgi:ribosomal protein S18 acetylase RimI-like enzyme
MLHITISKVNFQQIDDLQKISQQTFIETFAESNTKENIKDYVNNNLSIAQLSSELSIKNSRFYFAIHNREVIGYLKINLADAQTELKRENSIEIERIYILKDYHGKKVAQLLFETALTIANERNASFIWLGVWEHNPKAIHFYKKYGFIEFDKHIFRLGNDDQTDIMMKLIL